MQFSLTTLLWSFALVASALAAFGAWGALAAALGVALGSVARRNPDFYMDFMPKTMTEGIVLVLLVGLLIALLTPTSVVRHRRSAQQYECTQRMREILHALIQYESAHGSFPPAKVLGDDGQPLHSWRSLVLPYLERSDLFDAVRWDEAWDSPANQAALSPAVDIYTCPSRFQTASGHDTSYFVVTGPGTLWPPDGPRSLADIPDGAENTVLLIEGDTGVPWAKPEDLTLTEAVELLTSPHNPPAVVGHASDPGYFYRPAEVRHVLMADGRVLGIQCPISGELATALLSANGGEEVDLDEVHGHIAPPLDWRRCGGLAFFVLAAIAPALPPIGRWLKEELAHALHGGTS